ncbi:hypothetical protein N7455_004069 [Penicillium solitum]|uniref:uncharacterized protein n=1 Tax=Penicillium solitum TaxID=60172 RepID=UPI0032C4AC60|nr:hypothetical protein N7455_004069 [Penicillium solitum]
MADEKRKRSGRPMRDFRSYVEIGDNFGRVLDYLESTRELENTLILFIRDDGAEGAALGDIIIMEGEETFGSIIEKYYDNSLENMGDKDSFIWYGMFGINDPTYIKNLFDQDFKQVPDGRVQRVHHCKDLNAGSPRVEYAIPALFDIFNLNNPARL